MPRVVLLMVVWACAASGCSRVEQSYVLTGKPRNPIERDVRIMFDGEVVPPGFESVAIVQAVDSGDARTRDRLFGAITAQARALGCDVVVRVQVAHGSEQTVTVGVAGVVVPISEDPQATRTAVRTE